MLIFNQLLLSNVLHINKQKLIFAPVINVTMLSKMINTKKYHNRVKNEEDIPEKLRPQIKPFKRAFEKLSGEDKKIVKDIIMKRGKIETRQYFTGLKNGSEPINIERRDIIESVFRAYYLDAWTGEPLNI